MEIRTGVIEKPQRVVIYGPEGIGKSLFASQFPKPVFIDTEGSTEHMDVQRTPVPSSWAYLLTLVSDLCKDPMGFKTTVLDTADWAQRLCATQLCATHEKDGIEAFGYNKGFTYLAEEFGRLLDGFSELRETGMNIVINAHATTRKFDLPEEEGSFDKWEMKLEKKVFPLVREWADMVLFVSYKTIVITDSQTKKTKAHGAQRMIRTTHTAVWDAKNRHDLDPEYIVDDKDWFKHIAHCIPGMETSPVAETPKSELSRPSVPYTPPAETPPTGTKPTSPGVMKKIHDMTMQSGITDKQVQFAVAAHGFYIIETPIKKYGDEFIEGKLLSSWAGVVEVAKTADAEGILLS